MGSEGGNWLGCGLWWHGVTVIITYGGLNVFFIVWHYINHTAWRRWIGMEIKAEFVSAFVFKQPTWCNFSFLFVMSDKFTPTVAQGVLISLRSLGSSLAKALNLHLSSTDLQKLSAWQWKPKILRLVQYSVICLMFAYVICKMIWVWRHPLELGTRRSQS